MNALRLAAALAFACTAGCGSSARRTNTESPAFFDAQPRKPAHTATVVVFLPTTARVRPVWTSLSDELSETFEVVPVQIDEGSTTSVFQQALGKHKPACVVLIDNRTTNLYARYQAEAKAAQFPPAVVVLTSFVDLYQVKSSVSIAYEVPIVSSASNLRQYIERPVERVGVVYRRKFATHVQAQARLAKVEKLEVVGFPVPDDATPRELAHALYDLVGLRNVDTLWVLNDNALLSPEHIANGWLPLLSKDPVPTIVGIPGLVTPEVPFGTFAVVPDLSALGVQAANLIYDLQSADWKLDASAIEQPFSVETMIDLDRARAKFGFKEEMRGELKVQQ